MLIYLSMTHMTQNSDKVIMPDVCFFNFKNVCSNRLRYLYLCFYLCLSLFVCLFLLLKLNTSKF